ncbi:MAG TPA: hypothetical protein PL048_14710 [Leptospiraceae bacterium]|nr:hypothetical protein [Leptospiraceae bacterium]
MNFAVTDPPADVGSATTFTDASQALGALSEFSARRPISVLELFDFLAVHPMRVIERMNARVLIRLIAVCCLHGFYFHRDFSNEFILKEVIFIS